MSDILKKIQQIVDDNSVVLFMKGSQDFPQCGFSALVAQILKNHKVKFLDINVLNDPEIRQAIKDFSDWPTIPQLYINGNFIGGCDIVKEMESSGELVELLTENKII